MTESTDHKHLHQDTVELHSDLEHIVEPNEPTEQGEAEGSAESQVEQDIQDISDIVAKLTDERDQLRDQVLRAMADFQNMKKRHQQESLSLRQFATENLVRELLPVLDNFERTVAHLRSGASIESMTEGVSAVEKQLRTTLESQNVTRIISVGSKFDPELHEALGIDQTTEVSPDTITFEIEPGYKMGNKVVRPARVRVAALPS